MLTEGLPDTVTVYVGDPGVNVPVVNGENDPEGDPVDELRADRDGRFTSAVETEGLGLSV